MPGKYCAYGLCKNDSKYVGLRPELEGVIWFPFPKPWAVKKSGQKEKAQRWIKAIGRKEFTIDNITKNSYVCSKHFLGGNGPTLEYPDPIPYGTSFEKNYWEKTTKHRKCPDDRENASKRSKPDPPVIPSELNTIPESETNNLVNISSIPASDASNLDKVSSIPGSDIDNLDNTSSIPVSETDNLDDTECVSGEVTEPPNNPSSSLLDGLGPEVSKAPAPQTQPKQTVPIYIVRVAAPVVQKETCTIGTQTDVKLEHLGFATNEELKSEKKLNRKLFVRRVTKNDISCKFYTGLTLSTLAIIFGLIEDKASRLNYWKGGRTKESAKPNKGPARELSILNQFLLTLVRLRRGVDHQQLADLFGTSTTTISRTFTTWINFLALELKFLVRWPTKEQVLRKLPSSFNPFRRTRALIDCTEIFIQRPKRTVAQKKTWSSYKHHNTFKALLATTPRGVFSFVSDLWTGNTSDKKLTEESGFLDNIEHGDDVMADRGFLIRDLLAVKGATLNIPPFAHGRQLTAHQTTKTRRIARARIHVERAIGRLKNFRVLSGVLPLHLKDLANQIVKVCTGLCNLDTALVKCKRRRSEI